MVNKGEKNIRNFTKTGVLTAILMPWFHYCLDFESDIVTFLVNKGEKNIRNFYNFSKNCQKLTISHAISPKNVLVSQQFFENQKGPASHVMMSGQVDTISSYC